MHSQNKCVKFEKKASNDYHAHIDKKHYLFRSKASFIREIFFESISMYIYLVICVRINPNKSANMRLRLLNKFSLTSLITTIFKEQQFFYKAL